MSIAFLARDGTGAPLAGLTPTWTVYLNAVTGAGQTAPTITELALGHYKFDPSGTEPVGFIDLGATAAPRYLYFAQTSAQAVFPAYDEFGAPLAGLTPVWASLRLVSDGTAFAQPTIAELSGGLYKFPTVSSHVTGVIDLTTAYPRYFEYDSEGGSPPTVTNMSPPNGDPIYPDTPIQFDILDADGFTLIIPMIILDPFRLPEPTHNNVDFEPLYREGGSTRVAIADGYRYTLRRKGGWTTQPQLMIWAVDVYGAIYTS